VLTAYRVGDPQGAYPIFDAKGSTVDPGRWNTAASPVIYPSEHYSMAMLEKLVNGSGHLPPNQHYVAVTIPNGCSYEMFNPAAVPDWFLASGATSLMRGPAGRAGRAEAFAVHYARRSPSVRPAEEDLEATTTAVSGLAAMLPTFPASETATL
jgi:RES domain-containing protein